MRKNTLGFMIHLLLKPCFGFKQGIFIMSSKITTNETKAIFLFQRVKYIFDDNKNMSSMLCSILLVH